MRLRAERLWNIAVVIALFGSVALVYGPGWSHGFVSYDDPDYVIGNPHVLGGLSWENTRWAFTTTFGANYFPLTWLTLMAQAQWFGRWAGGYHLVDAAVHALNAILLWRVLIELTGRSGRAAVVAGLFAVHPMHVESVAWVAEWKDVFSTFWALVCLGCYARYVRHRTSSAPLRRWWYAAMVATYALSLLIKPMYVTLPAVMLLLDAWPLRRAASESVRNVFVEKLPLVGLAVLAAGAAIFAQTSRRAAAGLGTLPAAMRVENAVLAYGRYLAKLIMPTGLAVFYPYPPPAIGPVVVSALVLVGITLLAWRLRRREPAVMVGWAWFLGTLVPVIGLVQVGAQSMADRYSYFPSIGIFWAVTWLIADWLGAGTWARVVGAGLSIVVIAGLTAVERVQVGYWRDTQTLFEHAAAVTRDNWVADLQLGNLALAAGDRTTAYDYYRDLARLRPADGRGYNGMANCLLQSNVEQAIGLYHQALQRGPGVALFHLNLAKALGRAGDRPAALAELRTAAHLDPGLPEIPQLREWLSGDDDARSTGTANHGMSPAHPIR